MSPSATGIADDIGVEEEEGPGVALNAAKRDISPMPVLTLPLTKEDRSASNAESQDTNHLNVRVPQNSEESAGEEAEEAEEAEGAEGLTINQGVGAERETVAAMHGDRRLVGELPIITTIMRKKAAPGEAVPRRNNRKSSNRNGEGISSRRQVSLQKHRTKDGERLKRMRDGDSIYFQLKLKLLFKIIHIYI